MTIVALALLMWHSAHAQAPVTAPPAAAVLEPSTVPSDSNNKAQPAWNQECLARVQADIGKPVDILFIGDSITQNWTGPDWGGERRGRRVWDQYYAARNALNFGVGADKTQNVLWRLDTMPIQGFHPKVAVLMIGANNYKYSAQQIADGTRAILDKTEQLFPGIEIILVSTLPNRLAYQTMMDADALTRKFADNKTIFYLDLVPLFVPNGDNWVGLGADHLHPNETGYLIWAKAMEPLLDRLLKTGPTTAAKADFHLAKVIGDHAVLQRGGPIHIWGWAAPGAHVTVALHKQSADAVADRIGAWSAWLTPETAGGPYTLTAHDDQGDTVSATDILIGDVWLASGQSNMQLPMAGWPFLNASVKDAKTEMEQANFPRIRLLLVNPKSSDFPLDEVPTAGWAACTPQSVAQFSALAYFFGRAIAKDQGVPIGLIDASVGATPADSWISLRGIVDASLLSSFANRASFEQQLTERDKTAAANQREADEAKAAGKPIPAFEWTPDDSLMQPAALFNGMIAPLTGYSLKGFLWYQGESDSGPERAPYYAQVFETLIEDWRRQFAQGDLPFLYVQISSFKWRDSWGMVRDAQRRALDLRSTAMVVTLDAGDAANIHPPDKQTVAARLALAARGMVYGEDVAWRSPLYREATSFPGGMRVWFDYAKGLTSHGQAIEGFELGSADHVFAPAQAAIQGDTVVVKGSAIANPRYVRYAFRGVAPNGILYNAAGLPASTFTSEEFDVGAH